MEGRDEHLDSGREREAGRERERETFVDPDVATMQPPLRDGPSRKSRGVHTGCLPKFSFEKTCDRPRSSYCFSQKAVGKHRSDRGRANMAQTTVKARFWR